MATGIVKQSNHKIDESMKTDQSVGLFGQLILLVMSFKFNLTDIIKATRKKPN